MNKKIAFLFSILLCISQLVSAQTDPGCQGGDCPIDGGASLLVGAGIVYGMKKIRDNKKSRKDLKDTI